MSEILGLGLSHYPGLLVPPERWIGLLKRGVEMGRVPKELFGDRARWPKAMLDEWGADEGAAAARAHEKRLLEGFRSLRAELDAFKPDLVLIWGDDQFENFRRDCVPAFCVYVMDK